MKKVILLFVLFPLFSFSQVLLDSVKQECYREKSKSSDVYDCYATLEGSKIYIENNMVVIDVVVSKETYEILDQYVVDSGEQFYTINCNGKEKTMFKHKYEDGNSVVMIFEGNQYITYK